MVDERLLHKEEGAVKLGGGGYATAPKWKPDIFFFFVSF